MPRFNILNPYSLQSLGIFPFATTSEVSSVIKLLKTEGTKAQAALAPFQRSDILRKVSDVLVKRREEFSRTISNETGKTIRDARWEMDRAANTFIASAEAARNVGNGEIQSTDNFGPRKDKLSLIFSRPMGLVLAICPFNFPVNLAAHKIGPAFAGGNTIFLKPHPHGYLSAKLLVDACYEAGMPRESIQLCIPEDSNLRHIAGHPDVNVVNLTGSVAAGKALAREAGYKKLLFELGGNDPLIVMPDANLQLAAQQAVDGRFGTAGQRCTAPKRLFIHETVFADFRDRVVALTSKLKVGDPSLEETDVGPVVHDRAAEVVWQRLQSALTNGGKALVGNRRENNLIWPTVVGMLISLNT
jgi:acyl-CoA reductase-like NAD-dependent aldehyde dehydrogenase